MVQKNQVELTNEVVRQMDQQLQTLRLLIEFYLTGPGKDLLQKVPAVHKVLVIANGKGLALAQWAARQCSLSGLDARAVSLDDLAKWPRSLIDQADRLVFLPLEQTDSAMLSIYSPADLVLINGLPQEDSAHEPVYLPMLSPLIAWDDSLLNCGVLCWLLCRQMTGSNDGSEADKLKNLRQRLQLLVEGHSVLLQKWQKCLYGMDRLAVVASGGQILAAQATADALSTQVGQQCALFNSLSALNESAEWIGPGWGVIHFSDSAVLEENFRPLFEKLDYRGAACIRLAEGYPQFFSEKQRPLSSLEMDLSVFLNAFSGFLLVISIEL
jgi:hypothetical protein